MTPGVDWLGAVIVGVPLFWVSLAAWAGLRYQRREARLRSSVRRHPASQGRPRGHERLSNRERLELAPRFRRIAEAEGLGEVLDAVMAETEGGR